MAATTPENTCPKCGGLLNPLGPCPHCGWPEETKMRGEAEVRARIEKRVKELEWAISNMAHMKMERMDGAIRELRWMLGEE